MSAGKSFPTRSGRGSTRVSLTTIGSRRARCASCSARPIDSHADPSRRSQPRCARIFNDAGVSSEVATKPMSAPTMATAASIASESRDGRLPSRTKRLAMRWRRRMASSSRSWKEPSCPPSCPCRPPRHPCPGIMGAHFRATPGWTRRLSLRRTMTATLCDIGRRCPHLACASCRAETRTNLMIQDGRGESGRRCLPTPRWDPPYVAWRRRRSGTGARPSGQDRSAQRDPKRRPLRATRTTKRRGSRRMQVFSWKKRRPPGERRENRPARRPIDRRPA